MIERNISLKNFTSWLVGGAAEYFVQPQNQNELSDALLFAKQNQLSLTILGHGSNVLISDQGVRGLVICTRKLNHYIVEVQNDRLLITAEAGVQKSELLKVFLKYKLAPALFLAGIPGDVGGGVAMNAGVAENFLPREFVQITDWIEVMQPDGVIDKLNKDQLEWSYRHCKGWEPGIILRAGFSWENKAEDSIIVQVREANQIRLSKQPLDMPSCGSVFMNPANAKAAQLIDSCGLKGYTVGEAQVSQKHANFIVNLGQAKATDILQVISHVQKTVQEKTGFKLKTEVVRIGEWA